MKQLKIMASMQSLKAFVATAIAMLGVATTASADGFTLTEILAVLGIGFVTFQATYWTSNAKSEASYDGALIVNTSDPVKDRYTLEVTTPLDIVDTKKEIVLKVQN